MQIQARRRRGGINVKRLNIYLTEDTFALVERIAELRGIENGAAARELLEERIGQVTGTTKQAVAVPA